MRLLPHRLLFLGLLIGVLAGCGRQLAESTFVQDRNVSGLDIGDLSSSTQDSLARGLIPPERSGWVLSWFPPLTTDGWRRIHIFADTLDAAQRSRLRNGGDSLRQRDFPSLVAVLDTGALSWSIPSALVGGNQGREVPTDRVFWFTVWVQYQGDPVGTDVRYRFFLGDEYPPMLPVQRADSVGDTVVVLRWKATSDRTSRFTTVEAARLDTVEALIWEGIGIADSVGRSRRIQVVRREQLDRDTIEVRLSGLRPFQSHALVLRLVDSAGNASTSPIQAILTRDQFPPRAPRALRLDSLSPTSMSVSFSSPTDSFLDGLVRLEAPNAPNAGLRHLVLVLDGRPVDSMDLTRDSAAIRRGSATGASGRLRLAAGRWTWMWPHLRPGTPLRIEVRVRDLSGHDGPTAEIPRLDTLVPVFQGARIPANCPPGTLAVPGRDSLDGFCMEEFEHRANGVFARRISWAQAVETCQALGAGWDLCSESQWQRACAGDAGWGWGAAALAAGNEAAELKARCLLGTGDSTAVLDTASRDPRCRGPYGHRDLPGGLAEWTRDVYSSNPSTGPARPGDLARLGPSDLTGAADLGTLRGGSYLVPTIPGDLAIIARCDTRNYPAFSRLDTLPGRVVRRAPHPGLTSPGIGLRCCFR